MLKATVKTGGRWPSVFCCLVLYGSLWCSMVLYGALWCPTPSRYTHYTILQILGVLQPCPLQAARYRPYRASRILGNCERM